MHPWMLVETTHVTEFEYYFTYTHKGVLVRLLRPMQVTDWKDSTPK